MNGVFEVEVTKPPPRTVTDDRPSAVPPVDWPALKALGARIGDTVSVGTEECLLWGITPRGPIVLLNEVYVTVGIDEVYVTVGIDDIK